MKKLLIISLLALIPFTLVAKDIKVCVDDYWFPYTFVKDSKAAGVHVDIVRKAIEDLGDSVEFDPLPWKRCLKLGELGKYDAIMSASYKDDRAKFAFYPADAKNNKRSKGRIDQIEHKLIVKYDNSYEFDNNWSTIPQPVGVGGLGSSITKTIEKKGLNTIETNTKSGIFSMLMTNRVKSVALNPILANDFNTNGKFKGKLKISKIPLTSKSYHIIFSKKGKVNKTKREEIWNSLEKTREDMKFMVHTFKKYEK